MTPWLKPVTLMSTYQISYLYKPYICTSYQVHLDLKINIYSSHQATYIHVVVLWVLIPHSTT